VCWLAAIAGSRKNSRRVYQETRDVVMIDKRADSNQVTMPPQSSAEVDLKICESNEVESTSLAPRTGGGAVLTRIVEGQNASDVCRASG